MSNIRRSKNIESEKENKYKIEKTDKNITSLNKSNDNIICKNTESLEENKTFENDKKKGLKRSSGSIEENNENNQDKKEIVKEPDNKKQKQANTLARHEREDDIKRLNSRQKQIDYGKNTVGYEKYLLEVPKNMRKKGDPKTPDKYQKCSKRSWDGQIKKWRRQLHQYDPTSNKDEIEVNPNELAELEADKEEEEIIVDDSQDVTKESESKTSSESNVPTVEQKSRRLWSDMLDDEDAWVINPYSEPIF